MESLANNVRVISQFFLHNTGVIVRFLQKSVNASIGACYIQVTIEDKEYYSPLAHTEEESKPLFLMMFRQLLKLQSSQGLEGIRTYCNQWQKYRDEIEHDLNIVAKRTPDTDNTHKPTFKH